jgi:hypothetical protein
MTIKFSRGLRDVLDEAIQQRPEELEPFINPETFHVRTCRCDACNEYWARQRGELDRLSMEQAKIAEEKARAFTNQKSPADMLHPGPAPGDADARCIGTIGVGGVQKGSEPGYTEDSPVSQKKDRINELVSAHWAYMEKTLTAGHDKTQMFTWHQVMEMRKWDYTSSAKHFYGHGYEDANTPKTLMDLEEYIRRHMEWSAETFGPGDDVSGVVNHIRKELKEIEASPDDIFEWIDVIILGIDGALKRGYTPTAIISALEEKQKVNFAREWPDWRQFDQGEPIEHIRGKNNE